MAPLLTVNDTRVTVHLDEIGPRVRARLFDVVTALEEAMTADARARAAAHIRFQGTKPGQYLASIVGGVSTKTQNRITGYVRSGHPLAHLLEYGAHTPAHEILPKVADVLAFMGDAGMVFAKAVHHPGATIPAYPAINPAFEAMSGRIKDALTEAVKQGAGE